MGEELTPEELRKIARGGKETDVNELCPFCGTPKLVTRVGSHIVDNHRQELYEAVADYKEE